MSLDSTRSTNPFLEQIAEDPEKGLRPLWFTSEKIYELERRSIFSREWLLVSHKCRFQEGGRWLKFDIGGYPIILVRDRTGNINGFHNVCRHRAYNIVDGDQGKASIFSCKYHGWSYGLNGKLAKAPGYQELPEFKKEENGLFSVHVKLDSKGLVWVNLDGNEVPEIPWNDTMENAAMTSQSPLRFGNLRYNHSESVDVEYNWKLAMKSSEAIPEQTDGEASIISSSNFPNTCITTSAGFMIIRRVIPRGTQKTSIVYDVYRSEEVTDEASDTIERILKRALTKDADLCTAQQKSIDSGAARAELQPKLGQVSLPIWEQVHKAVVQHYEREQIKGQELWPAQKSAVNDQGSRDNILFCSNLGCWKKKHTSGPIVDIESMF